MSDLTEGVRRELVAAINADPGSREALEAKYGKVWDTAQLQADFSVVSFAAPFCSVVRRSDNKRGLIAFQHDPRFYFAFQPIDR
jgi:hypothetical protein